MPTPQAQDSATVASVVVTYDAPAGFGERLRAALAQTDFAVVFDNGSARKPELDTLDPATRARVQLLESRDNLGLAAALNRGVEHAAQLGASHALLLDHDSTPRPGFVAALLRAWREYPQPDRLAAIVPGIAYAHPDIRCRWPKSPPRGRLYFRFVYAARLQAPTTVDLAIGSGMLVDIATWRRVGRFDEALFIDLVDTEYCLRARAQGREILAAPEATLEHQLGHVEKRRLLGRDVFPTHHGAMRHYYISRNRVILAHRYAWRFPNWLAYELLGAAKLSLKVLLFEPGRGEKLRSMCRGTLDGLRLAARTAPPAHG